MFLVMLFACKPPPPAPEGLDAVTSYMVREFYSEDEMFEAGVQGFMNWYSTEGYELVGASAEGDNTETFTLNDLQVDDVAHLPLDDDGRDLSRAKGVISLAEMKCNWKVATTATTAATTAATATTTTTSVDVYTYIYIYIYIYAYTYIYACV